MPLVKSPGKAALKQNIQTELDAGRPIKQAVAISYAVKRRSVNEAGQRASVLKKHHRQHGYA